MIAGLGGQWLDNVRHTNRDSSRFFFGQHPLSPVTLINQINTHTGQFV